MRSRMKLLSLATVGALAIAGCGSKIGTASSLDGAGVGGQNYRVQHNVGDAVAATVLKDQVHAFYLDNDTGELRHTWYTPATGLWLFEILDGSSTAGGRTANRIDKSIAAFTFENTVHVAYQDSVTGALRHAWYNGGWNYEIIDGVGSQCKRPAEAAGFDCPSQTNREGGQMVGIVWDSGDYIPHLVYRDDTTGSLRHAWFFISPAHPNNEAWKFWRFENVDGNIAAMPKSTRIGVAEADKTLHIFYVKQGTAANASLGHAYAKFMVPGWGVEYLDGPLGIAAGATSNDIAGEPSAVIAKDGVVDVFYQDATRGFLQNVRYTPGVGWALTNDGLDGLNSCCGGGRTGHRVGRFTTAELINDRAAVAYYDEVNKGISWGVLGKNGVWAQQPLDGQPHTDLCLPAPISDCNQIDGHTGSPTGNWMTSVVANNKIYLFSGLSATAGMPAPQQRQLRVIIIDMPSSSPLGSLAGALGPILGLLGLG